MLTATRQTKSCQIERNIHVAIWSNVITATITEFKALKTKTTSSTTIYQLRKIDSQMGGVGVEIEKRDGSGEVYHVLLNGRHGHECSCPHGTYRANSGTPCRHVLASLEAKKQGLI